MKNQDLDHILNDYDHTGNQKKLIIALKTLCGDKVDSDDDTNINYADSV